MTPEIETISNEVKYGTAMLIDVREQEEWDEGHLEIAKLVQLSKLESGTKPEGIDKGKKLYLHCRSGNRVQMAKPILESMGYTDVTALDEGFEDLVSEGLKEVN